MKFVLASSNAHKCEEIRSLLPARFELQLQSTLQVQSVPETGLTFIENALIKARHAAQATGLAAIADDSGICVPALGGAPGIYSARYAGTSTTDADNRLKLLQDLNSLKDPKIKSARTAFFQCVVVCIQSPLDPTPIVCEGRWIGEIALQDKGSHGFGYDPIFLVPTLGRTAAELSSDEKNALSHRGIAIGILRQALDDQYPA